MRLPCIDPPPETEFRTVYVNQVEPAGGEPGVGVIATHRHYANNIVVTSKYTWWNFVPKNLFEQFRRIANFYFLIIVIVQFSIQDRTPVSPATSLLPLAFVIFITAVKQGFEDWRRHRADKEVNNKPAVIIQNGTENDRYSKHIKVGDIVKVNNNDEIPCDLVVISSSDVEGKCHIMTANLDGETNLKMRQSLPETTNLKTPDQLSNMCAVIECDHPEYDMYKFNGRLKLFDGMNSSVHALHLTNLLLRGAKLKNTEYAYGVAVYTGRDTKMAKNQKEKTHKFSTVERTMNTYLLVFLAILLVLTIICTILKTEWDKDHDGDWYLPKAHELDAKEVVVNIFSFLVLFNYIIPISLYVTVEVQKFFGAQFFNWDENIYHKETDEPAIANTSDLNEELGQIEYVFSDKTGTLTENDMQFRRCSINGVKYMEVGTTNDEKRLCKDEGGNEDPIDSQNLTTGVKHFFYALGLCHTVEVETKVEVGDDGKEIKRYFYQASSPDEKALCEAAARYGVVYIGKDGDFMQLEVSGKVESFKLLHCLDFDTTRKRMSVIVENARQEIIMFCKGADSHVLPLCTVGKDEVIRETRLHIDSYAELGLRTLTICSRELSNDVYAEIDRKLTEANQSISDREEQLAKVFDEVERDYSLLGSTAVEDKLQDYVKDTMETLADAGLKVWVLTGDKQETAENISASCGHIKSNYNILRITQAGSVNEIQKLLNDHKKKTSNGSSNVEFALVVDGSSLAMILVGDKSNELEKDFLEVGLKCQAVLCCRMSPLQKAHVVKIVKRSKNKPITLAIGDGANDCSMIQEAHVGCGIMGKEGRQAVRCSDYAFHRFHYLRRVLLVHGHYFYTRLSNTVQYFFYKNVAFMLPQFLYQFWNGYSTLPLYSSIFLTAFNIFFASLPVLFYGIFEQDLKAETLFAKSNLYMDIARNSNLSWWQFLWWSIAGLWHGLVMYFGTKELYIGTSFHPRLLDFGYYTFGTFIFTLVVIVTNLKMALLIRYWTWFMHVFVWGSILFYLIVVLIFCGYVWPWPWLPSAFNLELDLDLYNVIYMLMDTSMFWLGSIFLVTISLLPDIIVTVLKRFFSPTETQKAQNIDMLAAIGMRKFKKREYCWLHETETEEHARELQENLMETSLYHYGNVLNEL